MQNRQGSFIGSVVVLYINYIMNLNNGKRFTLFAHQSFIDVIMKIKSEFTDT